MRHAILFVLASLLMTPTQAPAAESDWTVDFRYALPWWQSTVSLPDDPDKVVLGKEGQLLSEYDPASPGVRNFDVMVHCGVAGGSEWLSQELHSARVPILRTVKQVGTASIGTVRIEEETFVVPPSEKTEILPRLTRVGGEKLVTGLDGPAVKRTLPGWAKPETPCDPAFADIAVGSTAVGFAAPIQYQLRVSPGKAMQVVVGLCEGFWDKPGQRPLKLAVEGAEPKTVDPVADKGKNRPSLYRFVATDANRDGIISIDIHGIPDAHDKTPIVNAIWAFDGRLPPPEQILAGLANDRAYAFANCGHAPLPPRQYLTIISYRNTGDQPATVTPELLLDGRVLRHDAERELLVVGHNTRCRMTRPIESFQSISPRQARARLEPIRLAPGQHESLVVTINRNRYPGAAALTWNEARQLRDRAVAYWTRDANLPFDTIQIPDAGIQAMVDSSIRNIYQARDIKNGLPAFHVGPTMYRCLWIVDGAFLLETAALLGRGDEARSGIDYLMGFQEEDGGFQLKDRFWKESGLVLWTVTRHAFLTQDKEWLRKHWPNLKRAVAFIHSLRNLETAADPNALEYRLMPWGDVDGGIFNNGPQQQKPEFSNVYWSLIGLKWAIEAARWLDENDTADAWQTEYDDFYATFRKAAAREMRSDGHGNQYLPIMMANALDFPPQRGQWTFCHAVYPGQLFAKDDPLVTGNMNMLKATEVQGLVFDTGWMNQGIWNYFASFYGHALLWQGEGQKAARVLYDFANHAAPTMVWREEQKPLGQGAEEVGDMPHNWASAEFIRLTIHLLALDRSDELHLFEGLPPAWTQPGMVTALKDLPTPFGPVSFELRVSDNGHEATLRLDPPRRNPPKRIVMHLGGWARPDEPKATVELPLDAASEETIELKR